MALSIRALHFQAGSSDKIWAASVVEKGSHFAVISMWGRRGTNYQTLVKEFLTIEAALDYYASKGSEKARKGYQDIDVEAWSIARQLEAAYPGAGTPPPTPVTARRHASLEATPPPEKRTKVDRRVGGSILVLDLTQNTKK